MNNESLPARLILASTSKYRKMLLQRFDTPFDCHAPEIDETPLKNESPYNLVERLAVQKANAVSVEHPQSVIIGSDQLAVFDTQIIGKPGTQPAALKQLRLFSGQLIEFLTAVSVVCRESNFSEHHIDITRVRFRTLQDEEIVRYLEKEKPFDCAGAFKAESLGITLFKHISSEDPTALIGLPLIQTAAMLRQAGLAVP